MSGGRPITPVLSDKNRAAVVSGGPWDYRALSGRPNGRERQDSGEGSGDGTGAPKPTAVRSASRTCSRVAPSGKIA